MPWSKSSCIQTYNSKDSLSKDTTKNLLTFLIINIFFLEIILLINLSIQNVFNINCGNSSPMNNNKLLTCRHCLFRYIIILRKNSTYARWFFEASLMKNKKILSRKKVTRKLNFLGLNIEHWITVSCRELKNRAYSF